MQLHQSQGHLVEGIRAGDYHLPEGFKVNEAITQSWDMLKKHWRSFQDAKEQLAEGDTGTSLTNERWLLPLFKELDYGRLQTGEPPVIEEKTYPIRRSSGWSGSTTAPRSSVAAQGVKPNLAWNRAHSRSVGAAPV